MRRTLSNIEAEITTPAPAPRPSTEERPVTVVLNSLSPSDIQLVLATDQSSNVEVSKNWVRSRFVLKMGSTQSKENVFGLYRKEVNSKFYVDFAVLSRLVSF